MLRCILRRWWNKVKCSPGTSYSPGNRKPPNLPTTEVPWGAYKRCAEVPTSINTCLSKGEFRPSIPSWLDGRSRASTLVPECTDPEVCRGPSPPPGLIQPFGGGEVSVHPTGPACSGREKHKGLVINTLIRHLGEFCCELEMLNKDKTKHSVRGKIGISGCYRQSIDWHSGECMDSTMERSDSFEPWILPWVA